MNKTVSHFSRQSWDAFFRNASAGASPGLAYSRPPSLSPSPTSTAATSADQPSMTTITDHLNVQVHVHVYSVCPLYETEKDY